MIDFSLSEEQTQLLAKARKFGKNEIRPYSLEFDTEGIYPEEILKKAHAEGWLYTAIPKEYGGTGLSHIDHYIVTEALNYECVGISGLIGIAHLSWEAILLGGTEEQKRKFIGDATKSYKSGCFCLTEPDAGSDAGRMTTKVEKKGDRYIINGKKCYITNGKYADLLTVFANIDFTKGTKGICCFAIPRNTPGISTGKEEDKMGQRVLSASEVIFENVEVSEENLIGKEGEGFKLAMQALDSGRVNIAAVSTGIAQRALDESVERANTREQFGRPVGKFQAIQFMLADMNALVMASRALYLQAGWMLDQHIDCSTEAAIAKIFASDTVMKVTTDAVQIWAGAGYMRGSVVEKLMRDAKLCQIYEGTNQINRMVAGRGVLKKSKTLF